MIFKPIPDNLRCVTVDARYITVAKTKDGVYRAFVTDSEYIQRNVIEPATNDCEVHVFVSDENENM